ncbi:hypothetical protein SLA2020_195580 [Shorea laevis]
MEEKLYEVEVTEEEWRADPDWWLTDDDRRNETESELGYSSSKNGDDKDHDLISFEIRANEEDMIDVERLLEEGDLNSKTGEATDGRGSKSEEDKLTNGLHREKGQRMGSNGGLEDGFGLNESLSHVMETAEIGNGPKSSLSKIGELKEIAEGGSNMGFNLGIRDSWVRKEKRELRDCYLQEMATGEGGGKQRSNGRDRQRAQRSQGAQQKATQGAKSQEQWAGSSSLSDGCIDQRNKVIQREMNLQEVRRILKLGNVWVLKWGRMMRRCSPNHWRWR